MDYNFIAEKTLAVYMACEVRSFPIDCFKILRHYNFRIYTYAQLLASNRRLYEMCKKYSDDAFRYQDVICYNQQAHNKRIRFSLMHELGHYILGHKEESIENEQEADYFASYILAPRIAIIRTGCRTADDIHDQFEVSYAAANRILSEVQCQRGIGWTDHDEKIGDWFFPPEPKIPIASPAPAPIPEPRRKETARQRRRRDEMEERAQFLSTHFSSMYGSICEVTDYPEYYG